MAQFLGDTMDFADCQLTLSDGRQSWLRLWEEAEDSGVLAVTYRMKIKDMVESEFIECISANAMDSLYRRIQPGKKRRPGQSRRKRKPQGRPPCLSKARLWAREHCQMQTRPRAKMMRPENLRTPEAEGLGPDPGRSGPGAGQPGAAGILPQKPDHKRPTWD